MEIHPSPPIASSSKHSHHQHSRKRRSSLSEDKTGGGSRRRDEGGEGRKRPRPPPPAPFPQAQRISLNGISRDTPASDDHYISGRVVDVRQWSEERRVLTLCIADDSTHQPLKILLKGSWVASSPKADGSQPTFAILLRGLEWETAAGIGGTRNYAAVFEKGAVFQLRDEKFDGFAAAKQITIQKGQAPPGALESAEKHPSSSKFILPSPSKQDLPFVAAPPPASLPPPPPVQASRPSPIVPSSAADLSSTSSHTLQLPPPPAHPSKRLRSPSPEPGPSSKRVAPSGSAAFIPSNSPINEEEPSTTSAKVIPLDESSRTRLTVDEQAPTPSAAPPPPPSAFVPPAKTSSPTLPIHPSPAPTSDVLSSAPLAPAPSPQPPMRRIITQHVLRFEPALEFDEQLLRRIVDGLIDLPQADWRDLLLSDEGFSGRVRQIKAHLLEATEARERGDAAMVMGTDDGPPAEAENGESVFRMEALVEEEKAEVGEASKGEQAVQVRQAEDRSSEPFPPRQPSPRSNVPAPSSRISLPTPMLDPPSTALVVSASKPVVRQPHPDDAPGSSRPRPRHVEHPRSPSPRDVEAGARNQVHVEDDEEDDDISLHQGFETMTPKYRYFCISDVKKQPLNRETACVGIVTKIVGPTKSSKDWYMIISLHDSTGFIDLKIFEASRSNLPPVKINDVLLVRETPVKKFHDNFELVGGSRDSHTWTFFDSELKTVVVQPNRLRETRDLVDIKKIDPSVKNYGRKLSRWLESFEESMIPTLRGRPTLRIEEIVNERQFFDCVCQVVRYEAPDVFVTDFTSNPLLEDAPPCYDAEPTRPFGQFTLKISLWNDLASDDISSLRPGRFVKLHNVKPRPRGGHWEGSIFNSSGGRIERIKQDDARLLDLRRRRSKHVKKGMDLKEPEPQPQPEVPAPAPPSPPRPLVQPGPVTIVVVPPPNETAMDVDDQPQRPAPLSELSEAGPPTVSIPKPSQAHLLDALLKDEEEVVLPSVKGKERERVAPEVSLFSGRARFETESSERMVNRPEDEVSPTQAVFYDIQHPNGTSLLEIVSTDRAKFRTRARIMDFAPKALEDVVLASCERCVIDLPSSDKRCRNCNDITGDFTIWRYRLVFVLSDGTASIKAAVFDAEDMLTLFPGLPPASEFANSPTNPMEYLETQLKKLVGPSLSKEDSSSSTRRPGPLLDLSLRKFKVRGVPAAMLGKEGWAWSYRVFQTVIR